MLGFPPTRLTPLMQHWQTIRIFISSTFRDMHAERDHLVRFVFPELREWCAERHLHLVDVDLRWGVTEEEAESGKVLEVCLDEIERCRPFFIGILGERYGWVPDGYEVEDLPKYDWLRQFEPGHSVTALEIFFGVVRNTQMKGHAYFYFRDPAFLSGIPEPQRNDFLPESEVARQRLADLKDLIRQQDWPVFDGYPCRFAGVAEDGKVILDGIEAFGQRVLDDLKSAIAAEHSEEPAQLDPVEIERSYHDAFAESRSQRFIGRTELLARLEAFANGDDPGPLVVVGKPGSGKSALLAKFAWGYAREHTDVFVLTHFIGASPGSADIRRTLLRLCRELARRFAINAEIPEEPEALRKAFLAFLETAAAKERFVLVVDALNQLQEGHNAHRLTWLPQLLPTGVRTVVSVLEGDILAQLRARQPAPAELEVGPLSPDESREIARQTLWEYRKRLAERPEEPDLNQMGILLAKPDAGIPLFLAVACEELRVFGEYESVTERVQTLAGTVQGLLQQMLERLELDHGERLTKQALSFLACSRGGLLESELLELLRPEGSSALPRAAWSRLFRALRPFLQPAGTSDEGFLSFSHRQLASAVRSRYLAKPATERAVHRQLASYFREQADPAGDATWGGRPRAFAEVVHHALESGDTGMIGDLVRAGFLEAEADTLGDMDALFDARQIAEALAEAGEGHRQVLIDCAFRYCTFSERVRGHRSALADFVRRGQLDRMGAVFQAEPDLDRRALLMVAAAGFLADQGMSNESERLLGDASTTSGSANVRSWSRCLTMAITRDRGEAPEVPGALQGDDSGTQLPAEDRSEPHRERSAPRRTASLLSVVTVLASDPWSGFLLFPLIFGPFFALRGTVERILAPLGGGAASTLLGIVTVVGVLLAEVAILILLVLLLGRLWTNYGRSPDEYFVRDIRSIDAYLGETQTSPESPVYWRLSRLVAAVSEGVSWDTLRYPFERLLEWARPLLRDGSASSCSDLIIILAGSRNEPVVTGLCGSLRELSPSRVGELLSVVARNDVPTINLVKQLSDYCCCPAILCSILPPSPDGNDQNPAFDAISRAGPRCISMAILEWLESRGASYSDRFRDFLMSILFPGRMILSRPLSSLEPFLWLGLFGWGRILAASSVLVIVGMMVTTAAAVGVLLLVALVSYDPFGLREAVRDQDQASARSRIKDALALDAPMGDGDSLNWWMLGSWGLAGRTIKRTLIALEILDPPEQPAPLPDLGAAEKHRIVVDLIRQRLVCGPARGRAVLAAMRKREWLEEAAGLLMEAGEAEGRQVGPREHAAQLQRALPVYPEWLCLAVTFLVGGVASLFGLHVWERFGLVVKSPEFIAALLGCVFVFSLGQHFGRFGIGLTIKALAYLLGICLLAGLLGVWTLTPLDGHSRAWIAYSMVGLSLAGTNGLAPAIQWLWRGGDVLYPSPQQLLSRRGVAVSLALILTALAVVI